MSLKLLDGSGAVIGEIAVAAEDSVVLGDFLPAPAFSVYKSLFEKHGQAANDQLLIEVDRLEEEIDSSGFYVIDTCRGLKKRIIDLQIMDGGISFRWV